MDTNEPVDWMLIIKLDNGKRAFANLWEAIANGSLMVRVDPLMQGRVIDMCADTPENRKYCLTPHAGFKPVRHKTRR